MATSGQLSRLYGVESPSLVIIASVEPVAVAPVSVVILTVIFPMNSLAQA